MSAQQHLYSPEFSTLDGLSNAWSFMTKKVRDTKHSRIHLESTSPKHAWGRCAPLRTMSRSEMRDFVVRGTRSDCTFRLSYIIPVGE